MGGFTLAEVLIVITGAAIIGTILITIMVQSSNIFTNQNTQVTQN
jgi:type II secretory pathway pseudopilin PulG